MVPHAVAAPVSNFALAPGPGYQAPACTILDMPLVSGAMAAGFTIVRPLGRGQIGELYLAKHARLPRRHALEILPADVSADPEYRERFNRESDLAAALWHPHIVSLHDRGEFEGQLWLSMDYVDGADAAQLLSDKYPNGMPPDAVIEIVSAIADALDYAHDHGLLHRCVKPSNILITDRRRILLAGFGVAQRIDDINSLTQTNTTFGTVCYAAPEQLMGDPINGRADQYALAGTAFHLLTGSPPFAHANPAVVISRHLNESAPRPGDVRRELAEFDEPFARALAKTPNDRFSRCQDFTKALQANHSKNSSRRDAGATADAARPAPSPMPERPPTATTPQFVETDAVAETDVVPPTAPTPEHPAIATIPRSLETNNPRPTPPPTPERTPAATTPRNGETNALAPTAPGAPAPLDLEADNDIAPTDVLPRAGIGDAMTFPDPAAVMSSEPDFIASLEPDVSGAGTDDTPATSDHRRPRLAAATVLAIMVVVPVGLLIVMALRATPESQSTPTMVETPTSVTTIPPARPAPAKATPSPIIVAPAPMTTPPQTSTRPPAPATIMQPASTPAPAEAVTPLITKPSSSPRTTPPVSVDSRPAVGMPCGPEQTGSTTLSNSGIPVSCMGTPGGFAWEPPGG